MKPTPFIKWAGGKRDLLSKLHRYAPKSFDTYHEPFVGGGAFFFSLQPKKAILSDSNERLIRTYRAIQSSVELVIDKLNTYPHSKEQFNLLRKTPYIDNQSDINIAAWLIYLNRTCFNGLYRVNQYNEFNVPFGDYQDPIICNPPNLRACSTLLKQTTLHHQDFSQVLSQAKPNDFIYFDPPYLQEDNSFTSYTQDKFTFSDHIALRDIAKHLKTQGTHILISNSDSPIIRHMYQDPIFTIHEVTNRRRISRTQSNRKPVSELLIT